MMDQKREVTTDDNATMPPGSAGPAAKWMVDDVQGPHAVVTDGQKVVTVPLEMLPKGTQPGDPLDDDIGAILTNDPTGDKNMAEQEPDRDDTVMPGGPGRRPMSDEDEDDMMVRGKPNMTKVRM